MLNLLSLLLIFLSQVTVSDSGFSFTAGDVTAFKDPMLAWAGSIFNGIVQFADVIIIVFFLFLIGGRLFRRR